MINVHNFYKAAGITQYDGKVFIPSRQRYWNKRYYDFFKEHFKKYRDPQNYLTWRALVQIEDPKFGMHEVINEMYNQFLGYVIADENVAKEYEMITKRADITYQWKAGYNELEHILRQAQKTYQYMHGVLGGYFG